MGNLTTCMLAALCVSLCSDALAQGAGHALELDGTNDYVSVAHQASQNITGALTIEAWIVVDDLSGSPGIIAKGLHDDASGATNAPYGLYLNTAGNIVYEAELTDNSNVTATSSGTVVVGTMTHIAVTRSASNVVRFFIDGRPSGETTNGGTIGTTTQQLFIGRENNSNASIRFFNGTIEEVRLWNVERSIAGIRESMRLRLAGSEPGLVGYWRFDDGAGSTAASSVAGGSAGTLTNGPLWSVSMFPLGSGISASRVIGSTGDVSFGDTDLSMSFTSKNGTDTLVVTRVSATPGGAQPAGIARVFPDYWIIDHYGGGTLAADLTYTLGTDAIGGADAATPANIRLFNRSGNSVAAWSPAGSATAVNEVTGAVVFPGITGFSQHVIGTEGDSPLPIHLSEFTLRHESRGVRLAWSTASEVDNAGYLLSRSTDAGHGFEVIATHQTDPLLRSPGNSTTRVDYSFLDTDPLTPGRTYFYRLQDVDLDGRVNLYGRVASITIPLAPNTPEDAPHVAHALHQNIPNPFSAQTMIPFDAFEAGSVTLIVVNSLGDEVRRYEIEAAAGRNVFDIDAAGLSAGIYYYRIRSGRFSAVRRMTIIE